MSYILWKNIHRCFPGFKCLPPLPSSPPAPSKDQERDHHNHGSPSSSPVSTSTTATPTSVLAKNYNSIYDLTSDPSTPSHSTSKSFTPSTVTEDLFSSSDDFDVALSLPDFATVCASRRFFFSSPGSSNSIVESAATATATSKKAASAPEAEAETETLTGPGGVAVHKYSPDPYLDFRRSMQEMVEARALTDVRGDWEYLHELLLCYLRLNPKHTHKFIIEAFTDLFIGLMALPEADKSRKTGRRRRQCGGSMG